MTLYRKQLRPFVSDQARQNLGVLLEKAILFYGADFGNIQRLDKDLHGLEIIAQRGFKADFVEHFRLVRMTDDSACGRALRGGQPVVIQDIGTEASFEKHRAAAAAAGFRAVISLPLLGEGGSVIGICSVHFREPLGYSKLEIAAPLVRDMARMLQKFYATRKTGTSSAMPSRKKRTETAAGSA